jgi:hypothetical protein
VPNPEQSITYADVLDPLTGERRDVSFGLLCGPPQARATVIDGSDLWVLPGLFDGDSHGPVMSLGRRVQDVFDALSGGVTTVGLAIAWDDVKHLEPDVITQWARGLRFPRVVPVLSLESPDESGEFVAWLGAHGETVRRDWASLCKINLPDEPYPSFEKNLRAIWDAGLRAAVYAYNDDLLVEVAGLTGGPVHHRHASTIERAALMRSTPGATSQVSPHYLLELDDAHAAGLVVLPPIRPRQVRGDLIPMLGPQIDMIATDHNAPVRGATGPGLASTEYFLPSLLTLAAQDERITLASLIELTTLAPARVLDVAYPSDSAILVDPSALGPVPLKRGQVSDRSPYEGIDLRGTVVAAVDDGVGIVL